MLDHDSYYSISSKLKSEGKTNEAFEVMLNNLHLEDIVALKLELSARMVKNKLYGFNICNTRGGVQICHRRNQYRVRLFETT